MIHIGILTWNGRADTQRCLASLLAHTRAPCRIVVRDNGSTDDTPAVLRAIDDPRVVVHLGSENLGVAGGRNWLLDAMLAEAADTDLLLLLDNDTEVAEGWEAPFVDAFARQPRLGIAGRWAFSMVVRERGRDILAEHGQHAGPVDTVQGCVFWIRARTAREVGRFDDTLGRFWHEDDDYAVRALHAGWDVRRVPGEGIVHHEHGTGVALDPAKRAGSWRNQAVLAAKWRALGALDEDGAPRRPGPEPNADMLRRLCTRLGRRVLRTELHSALTDATLLLHAEVSDTRAGTLGSPAARVLLEELAATGHSADRARNALARLEALRATRLAAAAGPLGSGRVRDFSALCTPAAWDDRRWFATVRDWHEDASGLDWFARSETGWRDGQLLYALRSLGALSRNGRVLLVGHWSERLIATLSHRVAQLVVADRDPAGVEALALGAQRPLGEAALATARWSANGAPVPGAPFDVVVCPNASRFAPAPDVAALLHALGRHVAPGGVVALAASVRLAGPADGRWLEPATLADDALPRAVGLGRVGRFDDTVDEATLLAAVPEDAHAAVRPRLARSVGPHVVTLATLVARRR